MVDCIHRGERLGITPVKACCGSEDFADLFACRLLGVRCLAESFQPLDRSVAICPHCPHRLAPGSADP